MFTCDIFFRYHLILKPIYRPELFSIVYNKILEVFSSENIENNETFNISNFDAGLSVILLSQFARDNVSFLFTIAMKFRFSFSLELIALKNSTSAFWNEDRLG